MATKVPWTDETWNPVVGCTPVSEGCRNCYAARLAHRGLRPEHRGLTINGRWVGHVAVIPARLEQPLHWRKPRRIFVVSMGDLFHKSVPDEFIDRVFVAMALCPQHIFQVLTKRAERMRDYCASDETLGRFLNLLARVMDDLGKIKIGWKQDGLASGFQLPHVWLGVTVENQKAKSRIDALRQTPAAIRFLSCEPLLEDLGKLDLAGIGWVIVGGESGPGARPCAIESIRSIVKYCGAIGVAAFVKQLGSRPQVNGWPWRPDVDYVPQHPGAWSDPRWWPTDLCVREYPT